jgi:hypothetical protein
METRKMRTSSVAVLVCLMALTAVHSTFGSEPAYKTKQWPVAKKLVWANPDTTFVELNGDGYPDVLISLVGNGLRA